MMMLNFFKPKPRYISGVLPDDRSPEEKAKDYLVEELYKRPITALRWRTWEEWKADPNNIKMLNDIEVNDQRQVGSCAAQSASLALAINNYLEDKVFLKLSAKPIYARRRNKPNRGMYMDDVGNICITYGTVPEVLYPTPNDTEENMSNLDGWISAFESMAKVLRAKNYFWLKDANNIDSFAEVLALNKPIVLTVVFGDGEFGNFVPEVKPVEPKYGHAVCFTGNTQVLTEEGYKSIKDIKVGEKVLTHKNRFRKVVKVMVRKYKGKGVKLASNTSVEPIIATYEHPILCKEYDRRNDINYFSKKGIDNFDWKPAGQVNSKDFVLNGVLTEERRDFTEKEMFLLGAYIGDGNLKRNFGKRFKTHNFSAIRFILDRDSKKELEEKIIQYMKDLFNLDCHFYYSKSDNSKQLVFYSTEVANNFFARYGGTPNNKKIDILLVKQEKKLLEALLEGLIATDGSISNSKIYFCEKVCSFFTSERQIANNFKLILDKLGIGYSVSKINSKQYLFKSKLVQTKGGYSFRFVFERKNNHSKYIGNYQINKIKEKQEIIIDDLVYNLEVEEDNSYIAEGIIVHNCVLPNAYFTYNGKKAILIQNSWGKGIGWNGRQILTEDWFVKNRVIFGIFFEDLNNLSVFNEQTQKPHYHFTRELDVGMKGADVAMLQVCLATLKDESGYLFPLWQGQEPTGYYGGLTRQAVKRFQRMYEIEPVGRVGPQTLQMLNEIFG